MGATNDNLDELLKTDPSQVCGIKIFMGSSTGNMLVDNPETLKAIFSKSPMLIAVHCEDESLIRQNTREARDRFGEDVPISCIPGSDSKPATAHHSLQWTWPAIRTASFPSPHGHWVLFFKGYSAR
jgi:dihydroorotase-like cyclic amidohydrolase